MGKNVIFESELKGKLVILCIHTKFSCIVHKFLETTIIEAKFCYLFINVSYFTNRKKHKIKNMTRNFKIETFFKKIENTINSGFKNPNLILQKSLSLQLSPFSLSISLSVLSHLTPSSTNVSLHHHHQRTFSPMTA